MDVEGAWGGKGREGGNDGWRMREGRSGRAPEASVGWAKDREQGLTSAWQIERAREENGRWVEKGKEAARQSKGQGREGRKWVGLR